MTAEQVVSRREAEAAARRAFQRSPTYPNGIGAGGLWLSVAERHSVEISYSDAVALRGAGGGGKRRVLTEKGWYNVDPNTPL